MFIFSKVSNVNYMLLVTVPLINNLICAKETTNLFCIQSISFDYGILCFRKSCQTQNIWYNCYYWQSVAYKVKINRCTFVIFVLVCFTGSAIYIIFVILTNLCLCVVMLRVHSLSHNASCVNLSCSSNCFPEGNWVHCTGSLYYQHLN